MCLENEDVMKSVGECEHSFCIKCLSAYLERQGGKISFPCPTCHEECPLPGNGLEGLAATGEDAELNDEVESPVINKEPLPDMPDVHNNLTGIKCQICRHGKKEVKATDFCPECNHLYLCGNCTVVHARTTRHNVVPLKTEREDAKCTKHNALLMSFCSTCNEPACKTCVVVEHANHKVEKLSTVIQLKVEEVKVALLKRQRELDGLKCQIEQVTLLKTASLSKYDTMLEVVNYHAENCIEKVVEWREYFNVEIEKDFEVLKDIPNALKDVTDSARNLHWAVSNATGILSDIQHQPTYLDKITSLHEDLDMLETVSQSHEGILDLLLLRLYITESEKADSFIPGPLPSIFDFGDLARKNIGLSKAVYLLLVENTMKVNSFVQS
jgi:tripartite motif-containing protein 2/3